MRDTIIVLLVIYGIFFAALLATLGWWAWIKLDFWWWDRITREIYKDDVRSGDSSHGD